MKSSTAYFIRVTKSTQVVVGLPEKQLKRTLKSLLSTACFPAGDYRFRVTGHLNSERYTNPEQKVAVLPGEYTNTVRIRMLLPTGTYIGVLTYPDQAISKGCLTVLVAAAARLPMVAMQSDDEVPKPRRAIVPINVVTVAPEAVAGVEADVALLETRLRTLTARIHELQGKLMLPRTVLHPRAKEPIRREIVELNNAIQDLTSQSSNKGTP